MARAEIEIKLTEVDRAKELFAAAAERIEQLEAAISSVRALADEIENGPGVAHLRLLIAQQIRAALDSSETPSAAPDGGHVWGSDGTWCRRCAMVRTAETDVTKWPCTGRTGVFRNAPPAAPVPEERSDEKPKKPPEWVLVRGVVYHRVVRFHGSRGREQRYYLRLSVPPDATPGKRSKWPVRYDEGRLPEHEVIDKERAAPIQKESVERLRSVMRSDSSLPVDGGNR